MYILRNNKKKHLIIILICGLLLIALVIATIFFPWDEYEFKWHFDINWSAKLSMEKMYDSYGGFPIDGERLYSVKFTGDDRTSLEEWESLPLPPRINGLIYGHNGEVHSAADRIGMPKVTSGKWKYVDRGNTSVGYEPFNFSICIYDEIGDVIYYYTCDT
ncbi:MAG: hypothetical protein IJU59_02285 [Firmicutes bacterium]|nr:hypothetical protein [Bacillota bacterium]